MKTLILVRHAKSSHAEAGQDDRDRPLNERGLHDAAAMGEHLARRGVKPDLLLSSPAVRARTTAQLAAKAFGIGNEAIAIDERIYAAAPATLLAVIREQDDRFASLMVFGHNPEFSELARRLSNGQIDDMPACGVAELHFGAKAWAEVGEQPAAKVRFDSPKS